MVKPMRSSLFIAVLFFFFGISSNAQTWNGSVSSAWNTAANWTPASVPGAGNDVTINNAAAPNQPILPSNLSIRDLNISNGVLDLASFTLTITRNANITGGTIASGNLSINSFNGLQNTVFNGNISITKTGGNNNDLNGGNTFNGPTVFNHNDNSRWRLANANGDTFNSTVTFNKNNSGQFQIAFNGSNIFSNTVTINNSNASSSLGFGEGGGSSLLTSGGLTTTGFNVGTLIINNFSQVTASANGNFSPAVFTVSNVVFLGNFQVTTTGAINFNNTNFFNGTNLFTAGTQITMPNGNNRFSVVSGSTQITRTGGGGVTWGAGNRFGNLTLRDLSAGQLVMNGGNIFNGTTAIINETNNNIQFANVTGDTFNGPVLFQNNGTAFMDVARRGTNIFEAEITINNTNVNGEVRFGEFGGTIELRNGGLVTTNFSVCNILELNNFTQLTNAANGSFNANTITFNNVYFRGNFQATTTGTGSMTFQNANAFEGNNTFTANSRVFMTAGGNTFSAPGNTTIINKNGGASDVWGPGNSFGTLILNHNTNNNLTLQGGNTFHGPAAIYNNGNGLLRLANTSGDTFLGTSLLVNNGTNTYDVGYGGTNTFGNTITLNNLNGAGTVRFGANGGTNVLNNGGLTTSNFNVGAALNISNFSQMTNAANGSFSVNTFTATSSSFQGDFNVTTTSAGITLTSSTFNGNNIFDAASGIQLNAGNNLSTTAGNTTTIFKRGTTSNAWQGGNVFGNLIVNNESTGILRIGDNATGDLFSGNATFRRNNTGELSINRTNIADYRGNITIVGAVAIGSNGGTMRISGGSNRALNASAGLSIPRLTMNTTGAPILTVEIPVTITTALTLNSGIIFNDENLLTINSGVTVTGGSNASHVDGRLRKIGNTAFTYPFGNDGFYAPLTTSALGGATTQHFTGRYFHTNPELAGYSRASKEATLGEINECEYWEFDRTNSAVTPTITLSWSSDRTCPIVDFNEFIVTKWNGTQWIDLEAAGLTGNDNSGSVRNNLPVPGFSPPIFTLAQSFRILPVELLSFGAVALENQQVRVTWSTASEENNAYFTVERSLDGKTWSAIGIVPGVGNSNQIESYEFMDEKPIFGRQFYRITQTDFDGKSQTFRVVGVTLTAAALEVNSYKVYPNPSSGQVKVFSENANLEQAEITIINQQGQEMMSFEDVNGRLFEVDLSHLPKGLYLIRIKNNHQLVSKKLVLQ
jgi:hypothetical protein